jgi:DNA-binding NarL/FixJ family response regulator
MKAIRVLIVDDVTQVRQDLHTVLTLAGGSYEENQIEIVGEAANGLEAIRQADALQPDVVLMDLEMPVLDGYQAARQIKSLCQTCRVIALSIHDYQSARQEAFQAGMDGFIVKGAPVETLVRAIFE